MALNKVMIIGNLGADPEVRNTPNGAQVANFRVAVTEKWKDQSGQKQEHTEWIPCVAWRALANVMQQFARKGSKVYVEGRWKTRQWEDKNGGGKRYMTEIEVSNIELLSYANDGEGASNGGQRSERGQGRQGGEGRNGGGNDFGDDFGNPSASNAVPADDDLPF